MIITSSQPCTARAAISTSRSGAEASVNIAKPATDTRFAPIRSPSAPAVRISLANASVEALTTH
jgi:hypothetical protein